MDKSASPITGYGFSKRIVDYYGTNKERGAGDVLLEKASNQWCDWLVCYDTFYQNLQVEGNKERFNSIIQDICALYNTRGGVVIIGIDQNDPQDILRNRGLQDYAKKACDQMCRHNTILRTKDERKRIKRLFETKVICCKGREAIALLVKSADAGQRYSIGNDTNRYYVRDENVSRTRPATGVSTANSALIESWRREDYLNRCDLSQKLIELKIPLAPPKRVSFGMVLRNFFRVSFSAKNFFTVLKWVSRLGFVIMTLWQFWPIGNEVCRHDGDLTIIHAFKTFILGMIPFVAPYWAAQGAIHSWGQSVVVSYLIYFWPYILYSCACLFTVADSSLVKRETMLKVGKCILFLAVVLVCVGLCIGYVSFKKRISAIGGYEVSSVNVEPVIGMNELVVRSVEAVEFEVMGKFSEMQPRDIYGTIEQADSGKKLTYLQMLKEGLMRVEAMYMPIDGNRTKLVEALGGPDQGLIDCLSAFSEAVNECISCHSDSPEDFDRMWQKANLMNKKFFERAKEIGIYNKGS